jgi:hypothetical protein
MILSFSSIALAHIVSKSINTEAGECITAATPECESAAVYGPNGFSGVLTFSADEANTTLKVVDFICVHTIGDAQFKSYGGSYTLTLTNGGAPLGSDTYVATGGLECTGSTNAVAGAFATEGATITVPADLTVEYTVAISGITAGASAQAAFASYNSIRNEAVDSTGGHARAISVTPPTTFIVPEVPFAPLLVLTGGIAAAWFVIRRSRQSRVAPV